MNNIKLENTILNKFAEIIQLLQNSDAAFQNLITYMQFTDEELADVDNSLTEILNICRR